MDNSDTFDQWIKEFGFGARDRRFGYSRQTSFHQSQEPHTPISIISNDHKMPLLCRTVLSIDIPPAICPLEENEKFYIEEKDFPEKVSFFLFVV